MELLKLKAPNKEKSPEEEKKLIMEIINLLEVSDNDCAKVITDNYQRFRTAFDRYRKSNFPDREFTFSKLESNTYGVWRTK